MKAFVIDWLDHGEVAGSTAWNEISSVGGKPFLLRTVAYIIKETEDAIFVAHTARDTECSTPFLIMKSAIVRMDPLKLPQLRRHPTKKEEPVNG